MTSPALANLGDRIGDHLSAIKRYFKTDVRVTLVIRQPEMPGDTGIVIGDDDYDLAIAEINRQRVTGTVTNPVCSTCNDTHRMQSRGTEIMCTRCPVPCSECRSGGNGPFCENTPCACRCHRKAG